MPYFHFFFFVPTFGVGSDYATVAVFDEMEDNVSFTPTFLES